jgi:shikimate dehydrogenase
MPGPAMTEPLRLAVIGDPVAHSVSPPIQRLLLEETGRAGTYEAIRVEAGGGAAAVDRLCAAGYRGLNVTTPLKEEAFARCDRRDAAADACGSVNTLVFERGAVAGYDTDGVGVLAAVRAQTGRPALDGLYVLVLGAGPTARAATRALRDGGATVALWNRTPSRAEAMAQQFDVALWSPASRVDLAFSTLPPSSIVGNERLRAVLMSVPGIIDANYGARATLAAELRRPVTVGLGMLVASARASFALFTA